MLAAESLERRGSGIARVARLMARVLADEAREGRLEVQALALNDHEPARDLELPVRTAGGSRLRFVVAVHAAALRCDALLYDFAGMARAHPRLLPRRRPYLVWTHGIEAWERARPDHLARLRAADVLVAPSLHTRVRAVALHAGLDRMQVCPLATEENDALPSPTLTFEATALVLARLDEDGGYKGHRELIACWPEVVRRVPNARLVIAGDGPGRGTVAAWVRSSPVAEHITLRGFVPEAELSALWQDAWLLAMPSRGEGFGVVYVEAMRRGVPVIASRHDAASEIVLDGETGYTVDLAGSGELVERLVALLSDRPRARALGAAGQARWAEQYRYDSFRERFTPLLWSLLRTVRAA